MADKTGISWADATWNPVIGCAKVATGCTNCYAEKMSKRLAAMGQADYASILDDKGRFNGSALPRPEKLADPLRWRKPRRIFVNSMSDLFHKDVPFTFVAAVFGVMAACPQHRFMVLTKRPERMREFFAGIERRAEMAKAVFPDDSHEWRREHLFNAQCLIHGLGETHKHRGLAFTYPLPNVELYVSGATQADVDANVPILLECPAAFRGLSLEPQVERVDVSRWTSLWRECQGCLWRGTQDDLVLGPEPDAVETCPACGSSTDMGGSAIDEYLHLVIQGGESGPNARPFDIAWARYTRDQCRDAGVLYHLKQLGARPIANIGEEDIWDPFVGNESGGWYDPPGTSGRRQFVKLSHRAGADPSEWPEDLRNCRDLPKLESNHERT